MLLSRARAPLGADEGYLWYGVQQLLKGRMPHRDFKSYEPGRYLWSGLFARLFGNSMLVLRGSTHLFFAAGLATALMALRTLDTGWPVVACAAAALAALSHPQHKQFEHGAILLAWAANASLWASPSGVTLAWAAATVTLSLFLGFNLFLYFGAALAATLCAGIALGAIPLDRQLIVVLLGSGALGLLPFGLMLCSPGFARSFHRRRVATVAARGESNLSLPLPWPWRSAPRQLGTLDRPHRIAFQWVFLGLFALPLAAIVLAFASPDTHAILLPAAALGMFVAHHAASRADPPHITQSLAPCGLLAIQLCGSSPVLALAVAASCLWLVWPLQPWVLRHRMHAPLLRRDAGGWAIDTSQPDARILETAAELCADAGSASLFAAPAFPALYARLRFDAPVYDTFSLYPAGERAQQDMIEGIERARTPVAIVSDAPVDGREELRFSQTHPLVWAHLHACFAAGRQEPGTDLHVFTR